MKSLLSQSIGPTVLVLGHAGASAVPPAPHTSHDNIPIGFPCCPPCFHRRHKIPIMVTTTENILHKLASRDQWNLKDLAKKDA